MVAKRRNWFKVGVVAVLAFLLLSGLIGIFQSLSSDKLGYIAKVKISGPIYDAHDVLEQLKVVENDDAAKGLLLVIDSPGGAVVPSERIYQAVRRIGAEKPVAVSMQSLAASGGYMVAVAGQRIFAYDSTLTGSIGVIMQSASVAGLLQKLGITPNVIKSGAYKDVGSPLREMSDKDRQYLQHMVMELRNQFVQLVAQSRKLPVAKVSSLADGRVFTGREAQRLGLVDAIGGESDAADWLKTQLKLPKDTEVKDISSTSDKFLKIFEGTQERFLMRLFSAVQPRAYFF